MFVMVMLTLVGGNYYYYLLLELRHFLIACNDSEPLTNWDFEKINELSIS
ncbi:TPA: hypothetical protein HH456_001773 [Escherichia coli]|uniref:Uncharacterized protein n=1 Tax=Peduovirus P22H1 TaxID=2844217 RepID=A0A653FSG8_9CAUD|nr:hypothetical protein HYP13_gp45 [Peduovirus P22H1]BDD32977.1 hypothetical protein VEGS20_A16030 [Escherichia coli]GMQ44730.1 hypothetical protein CRE1104_46620 [Escherichia coli O102:H6]VUD38005.1 hypothetical protein [Peduovirus P22H1]GHK68065.1 hypothetical protein ECZU11_46150 [Escherichia coli]HAH4692253.1 hypothetical protein [Escherichia coli]